MLEPISMVVKCGGAETFHNSMIKSQSFSESLSLARSFTRVSSVFISPYSTVLRWYRKTSGTVTMGVVVLVVMVMENMMVVMVVVNEIIWLAKCIMEMRMAFILAPSGYIFIIDFLWMSVSYHDLFFFQDCWLLRIKVGGLLWVCS